MLPYRDSRVIRITLFVFFALALGYGYYESRTIFFGPSIVVPVTMVTTSEPLAQITGRAERLSELRLNGKQIPITEAGDFNESYVLTSGSNRILLEASDARGRLARQTIDIIYIPKTAAGH